jgi:endonuclease YncB( thermonuclease family)
MDVNELIVNSFYVGKLATLDRVVDPDTIVGSIDIGYGVRYHAPKGIRLLGVDGPEKSSLNLKEVKACGLITSEIQDRLRYLLKVGQIWIVSKKWDMYGRVLGDLIFKDPNNTTIKSLNQQFIADGLLRAYDGKKAREPWTDEALDVIIEKFKLSALF